MAEVLSGLQPKVNVGSVGRIDRSNAETGGVGGSAGGISFRDSLTQARGVEKSLVGLKAQEGLKFSGHAIDRMRQRGITFAPEQLEKISSAIDKVKAKGGKETLMLTDNSALIVNIENKTVVTVMDAKNLKENVFTNIDSTIVI